MNEAYKLIEQELNGINIEKALKVLTEQKDKNLIVWFVVHRILERINLEWENEILPTDRVMYLEKMFKANLLFLIQNINETNIDNVNEVLTEIIEKYVLEYTSLSYQT